MFQNLRFILNMYFCGVLVESCPKRKVAEVKFKRSCARLAKRELSAWQRNSDSEDRR